MNAIKTQKIRRTGLKFKVEKFTKLIRIHLHEIYIIDINYKWNIEKSLTL